MTVNVTAYKPGERLIGEATGLVEVLRQVGVDPNGSPLHDIRTEAFHFSFRIVLPPGYEPEGISFLTYTCVVR